MTPGHRRDSHDATLAALLHEHASETPPPHVDAAVRAAAHREIDRTTVQHLAKPHARALWAWRGWMPLAAAAVIGVIVIGVLPLAPSIVDDSAQRASDVATESGAPPRTSAARVPTQEPASAPRTQEPAIPAPAQKPATAAPVQGAATPEARVELPPRAAMRREAAAPSLGLAARPQVEAEGRAESGSNASREMDRVQRAIPRLGTAERSKLAAESSPDADAKRSIADWIARIRALRDAGDAEGALRELRRYRATLQDADSRLPPDLAEWARSRH